MGEGKYVDNLQGMNELAEKVTVWINKRRKKDACVNNIQRYKRRRKMGV